MRVLVVEDQPLIALTLAETLENAGHEVVGPTATSAEALLLAQRKQPRLALVDIDLERRGIGLELAQRLHADHIAVLLTSGQVNVARSCECAFGLLAKPYSLEDARQAVAIIEAILDDKPSPHRNP